MPPTREKRGEWQRASRARLIEKYVVLNGHPLCACGCGGRVRFDWHGKPNTWINWHDPKSIEPAWAVRREDTIPIGPFRDALVKLKKQKGWTWRQMAELGGVQPGQINSLMYGKRREYVTKDWARDFLKRLSGVPAPATTWQKRVAKQNQKVDKQLASEDWYFDRPVPPNT